MAYRCQRFTKVRIPIAPRQITFLLFGTPEKALTKKKQEGECYVVALVIYVRENELMAMVSERGG